MSSESSSSSELRTGSSVPVTALPKTQKNPRQNQSKRDHFNRKAISLAKQSSIHRSELKGELSTRQVARTVRTREAEEAAPRPEDHSKVTIAGLSPSCRATPSSREKRSSSPCWITTR